MLFLLKKYIGRKQKSKLIPVYRNPVSGRALPRIWITGEWPLNDGVATSKPT
jgi:hypothetical protein